jgi:hypothetical protein
MAAVHAAAMNAGYPDAILQRVRRPEFWRIRLHGNEAGGGTSR